MSSSPHSHQAQTATTAPLLVIAHSQSWETLGLVTGASWLNLAPASAMLPVSTVSRLSALRWLQARKELLSILTGSQGGKKISPTLRAGEMGRTEIEWLLENFIYRPRRYPQQQETRNSSDQQNLTLNLQGAGDIRGK